MAVDARAVVVDGAVWSGQRDRAVRSEFEGPAAFVDEMMMPRAQGEQVGEIGGSAVECPVGDVMDLAMGELDVAAGVAARDVHRR